jgi:formylglycine-generating enzyme required for sulfatase activity
LTDIYISYAREDRSHAERLARALHAEGFEVWWDLESLCSGQSFNRAIQQALAQAKCVVVLWSGASVASKWVESEAYWAWEHNKLHSVRLDDTVPLPVPFNTIHARSLASWDGGVKFHELQRLSADIAALVGTQDRMPKAPPAPELQQTAPAVEPVTKPTARVQPPPQPKSRVRRQPTTGSTRGTGLPEPGMVRIEAGTFLMGCPERESGSADERPQHEVRIAQPFAIGKYAVTFDVYDAFAKETGRELSSDADWGRGRRPVINVSWEGAVAYALWLSNKTGNRYRLPTEAEWEYAARAGTTTPYSTGTQIDTGQANFTKGLGLLRAIFGTAKTLEVGSFPANPWGLCEVHGNVWEWVQDCWHDSYQGAPNDGSAWGTGDCTRRVLRGGSWLNEPWNLRSAYRYWYVPDWRDYGYVGFRVAQDL